MSHRDVLDARQNVTQILMSVVSNDEKKHEWGLEQLPTAIDYLNKTWDEFTDSLIRQREERDRVICGLIDDLAETRRPGHT